MGIVVSAGAVLGAWRVATARRLSPNDAAALARKHLREGEGHLQNHRYKLALDAFERSLALAPQDETARFRTAWTHAVQGQYEQAERALLEGLRQKPDHAAYVALLGEVYRQRGPAYFDKAIQRFEQSLQQNADNAEVCYHLGLIYQQRGQFKEASQYLLRTVRINPAFGQAYHNLAQVAQRLGKRREAQKALELFREYDRVQRRAQELKTRVDDHPDDPDAHWNLAEFLAKQEMWEQAIAGYTEVARLEPDRARAHERLAVIYGQLSRPHDAARERDIAQRLSRSNSAPKVEKE
jgi:tetratricopeptide (TPR) repeat protein